MCNGQCIGCAEVQSASIRTRGPEKVGSSLGDNRRFREAGMDDVSEIYDTTGDLPETPASLRSGGLIPAYLLYEAN